MDTPATATPQLATATNVSVGQAQRRLKVPDEQLVKLLADCPRPYTPWVHYKTGATYLVHGCAINEATYEPMVIYAPVRLHGKLRFTRPLREWHEMAEHNGQMVPRFCDATRGAHGS